MISERTCECWDGGLQALLVVVLQGRENVGHGERGGVRVMSRDVVFRAQGHCTALAPWVDLPHEEAEVSKLPDSNHQELVKLLEMLQCQELD